MDISYINLSVFLVIVWITYALSSWSLERSGSNEPIVENTWLNYLSGRSTTTKELVKDAYQKVIYHPGSSFAPKNLTSVQYSKNSGVFRIYSMCGLQYILPCSVLEEVRKLPSSVLDPDTANEDVIIFYSYYFAYKHHHCYSK